MLLSAHTFTALAAVESLHFDGNQIQTIERNAFQGMPRLEFLNLRDNPITEVSYAQAGLHPGVAIRGPDALP